MVSSTSLSMRTCASLHLPLLILRSAIPAPNPVAPPLTASEAPAIISGAVAPTKNKIYLGIKVNVLDGRNRETN